MPRRSSLGARAFQALLVLYPAAFRDEYGREMGLVFADRYREAAGPLDRGRLWLEVLAGVVTEAPKEHARMTLLDLRHALRRLRMSPAFAATSVATLALAIGASTTMFSVLNAVLLRPLPYESPDRLMMLWTEVPGQGVREGRSAYWNVEQWQTQSKSFVDMAVFDPVSVTLTRAEDMAQISVIRASPNVLPLLGVHPARGRTFSPQEASERQRVAVISHRFWQARFGGVDAIGASIELDGRPSQIIGVLPKAFSSAGLDADVWEPHTLFPDWESRRAVTGRGSWFVVGRLHPRVALDEAQVEMSAIARRLEEQMPSAERNRAVRVVPMSLHVAGPRPRLVLWMLTGAALCLLLVAIANVAGLSLARSVGRVPEMAIRAALGASRTRIVRQLLAEGVTLAAVSGVLGLLVAFAGIRIVRAFAPGNLARLEEVSLDPRVFGWALVVSLSSGVLLGLAPALTMWRRDLWAAGMEGGQRIAGGAATRLRRLLVVAECAVAVVLLVGAGLLIRSWWNVIHVDPGFRSERVLSASVATAASLADAQRVTFYDDVLEQVTALPGVERAGVSSELFVGNVAEQIVTIEGSDRAGPAPMQLRRDEVNGAFFEVLGTPLLRGRLFSAEDRPGTARAAIINEAMAGRGWPGHDPVGRRFAVGSNPTDDSWFTVVGVVGNMRRQGLEAEPIPQVFEALAQNPPGRAILFVRTASDDPLPLAPALRAAVRRVDTRALVYHVTTVDERLGAFVAQRRLQTSLLTAFSVVALLLSTMGIYALIQYSVATRTHEIGVRMALGAQAGDIFRMVVREGLTLSLTGVVLGLVGAVWLGQAGSSLLFGVTATDPMTFVAVSLVLVAVAAAACFLPARRAMAVTPTMALRQRVM